MAAPEGAAVATRWEPPRVGRSAARMFAGMGLVCLGAGTFLLASTPGGSGHLVRGNVPVNVGATEDLDIAAHNSPTLARDPYRPTHLAVVDRVDTPRPSCSLHRSVDGGETWADEAIPLPPQQGAPVRCSTPDLAYGVDGALHVSFVTMQGEATTPDALWVASAPAGGARIAGPVRVAGPLAFQPRLAADPALPGRLSLCWLQAAGTNGAGFATGDNPLVVARSTDGGTSWSSSVPVSPPTRRRALAPSLAVGPDGALLVAYIDLGRDSLDYSGEHRGLGGPPYPGMWSLVLARSPRHDGEAWSETVVERHIVPIERIAAFTPPSPALAVDRVRRRVYVGFHEGHLGDPDVWVWASSDGGRSFGRPGRVNNTPRGDGTAQYLPQLAVAPDGRLDVAYYDRRRDPTNVRNEVSLQSSSDGARTFTGRVRLSDRRFDSRVGFGSERGRADLGSRLGLVSTDSGAFAAWADTRAGTQASGKQDVAFAAMDFTDPSGARAPLRASGAVVAVLGAAAVVSGAARRPGRAGRGRPRP